MDSAICWIPYIYPVDNAEIPYPLATIERACLFKVDCAIQLLNNWDMGHGFEHSID